MYEINKTFGMKCMNMERLKDNFPVLSFQTWPDSAGFRLCSISLQGFVCVCMPRD